MTRGGMPWVTFRALSRLAAKRQRERYVAQVNERLAEERRTRGRD